MQEDLKDLQDDAKVDNLAENGETTPEAGFSQEYDTRETVQNEQKWYGAGDETRVYNGDSTHTQNVPTFGRDLF